MSIVTPEHPRTVTVGARPSITATRKLLTKRFGSLGFTISSSGLPYWEVLLFTDRSLIDPQNAGRRSASTFYSSRQDGGLRKAAASGDDDVFLVPSAVLRGFAAAVPKPTAIYYTVAAYTDPSGSTPVFPVLPELLAHNAPSVQVSPDFTPDAVDSVLGISASRLRVVGQALDAPAPAAAQAPVAPVAPVAAAPAPKAAPAPAPAPVDPMQDAAGGEDGYSFYASHPDQIDPGDQTPAPLVASAQPQPARYDDETYDDGFGAYDDGWGHEEEWAGAQSASFPAGYDEPAPLLDADELERVEPVGYRSLDDPDGTAAPAPPAPAPAPTPALALTIDDKRAIIAQIAGDGGLDRYTALNADGEYKGRFGPNDPAYHHHHIGLSFGVVQFTQESGDLGRLLVLMKQRDEVAFARIFGEHADELIAVTTAAGPPSSESPDGRSARTQPVAGADVWEDKWLGRFRAAGAEPAFQAAQNELASALFIDPMVRFAGDLGLDTDRALAIAVSCAALLGTSRAKQWLAAAVGPIQTTAVRQQALAAVGAADLEAFQRAHDLSPDNLFGPDTHAALVSALRALGSAAPIQLPTVEQMLDALVRRADADGTYWAASVRRLRTATGFTDKPYARL
jgi:hypothetical protein